MIYQMSTVFLYFYQHLDIILDPATLYVFASFCFSGAPVISFCDAFSFLCVSSNLTTCLEYQRLTQATYKK